MATLYKRYIPPQSALPKPSGDGSDNSPGLSSKRKRDRTQEEIDERKAKKLKKKKVDEHEAVEQAVINAIETPNAQNVAKLDNPIQTQPQGEFAHVKSAKKRHKLEKEARKLRKAEEKNTKGKEGPSEEIGAIVTKTRDETISNGHVDAIPGDESQQKFGKKKKRLKDEAEDRSANIAEEIIPEETESSKSTIEQEGADGVASIKSKKRRHKLEHVLSERQSQTPEDDEERLKKFSGILNNFQNSSRRSKVSGTEEAEPTVREPVDESRIIRDLVLPLPERIPTPEFHPDEPPSFFKRTLVRPDNKCSFAEIGLRPETVDLLAQLSFIDALPVQQKVIPLLLAPGTPGSKFVPGTESVVPDLAVEAATGSGKTLAYLLPIIESLRQASKVEKLRALIIVPTKELVQQVAAVAESLAKGSGIRIGVSTGSGRFRDEQERLIKRSERFAPKEYAALMARAKRQIQDLDEDSEEFELYVEELADEDENEAQRLRDVMNCMVNHIPTYESTVDVLVATPGRLLEHLNTTIGFNLVHLQWLIMDEVDKLLDNQFEGFIETVNRAITRPRTNEEQDGRERYLRENGLWKEERERRTRKAVLSATMTRDMSKLMSLQLRRPEMIVVRDSNDLMQGQWDDGSTLKNTDSASSIKETGAGFELPRTLVEYCVPAGDGSEKPLIILSLLESRILSGVAPSASRSLPAAERESTDEEPEPDSSSDSDDTSSVSSEDSTSSNETSDNSDDSSDSSDEASDSSDDASDSSDGETNSESEEDRVPAGSSLSTDMSSIHPDRLKALDPIEVATILIFTSSNESATRLSRLLKSLKPAWASWITALTKTNANKGPKIHSKTNEPVVVVSTDRTARGLDNIRGRPITHVIQYDVPRSMTSYIHRVGRTARAGRKGDAWTLFTRPEGRWFDNEILKSKSIKRVGAVERVKLFVNDQELRERFKEVLSNMREEVLRS